MNDLNQIKSELSALGQYLSARRNEVLRNWQLSVEMDPELTTSSSLSRAQFNDHIPQVLDAFELRLQAENPTEREEAFAEQKKSAAEHGLHRWQQGYNQRETIREWGHLHYCVLNELEAFGRAHTQFSPGVMLIARRALVRLCSEGVSESAARYEQLQRTEAASRVLDLENALQQLQSLDRQRAETWREAAHDLRGTVHVISSASTMLAKEAEVDPNRVTASQILQRSVASLRGLLTDLMDLARLEAGQEKRHVTRFDAAELLREFCDTFQPIAAQRKLFLKCEGPRSLPVEGDSVKILRIAQNLVLNALKATESGGVRVLWEERTISGVQQWLLSVLDTGPGFQEHSAAAPLEQALRQATAEAHEAEARAESRGDATANPDPAPMLKSESKPLADGKAAKMASIGTAGEGIGLSIVKRLCELLDATLELETAPGAGTTFRVVFPGGYSAPTPPP
jgi:signal transduction histidine kinase